MVQLIRRLALLAVFATLGVLTIVALRRLLSANNGTVATETPRSTEAPRAVPPAKPTPASEAVRPTAPTPATPSMAPPRPDVVPSKPASTEPASAAAATTSTAPVDPTAPETAAPGTTSPASAVTSADPAAMAPGDRTGGATPQWVPADDGGCPTSHPVKVKESSGIFHVPGGANHQRTRADRCYLSAEAAEADGYRAAKR